MHIRLHEFLHEIHFRKVIETWRPENVKYGDYVFVMKVA
jgi:hypothetical protein